MTASGSRRMGILDREARWMAEAAVGDEERLSAMVARRRAGEPLQYVLGSWSFRGLDLAVDRRVLIPRPETEQLVDVALGELGPGRGKKVVDLGTGSGAIAISIATERLGTEVWATDVSVHALEVATANAGSAGVSFRRGYWWEALPTWLRGQIDLVVSNPPYISSVEMPGLDPHVRDWEPRIALEAGERGTEAIEAILRGAVAWLRPGGALVVELAPQQGAAMVRRAASTGLVKVRLKQDLSGHDRILVAERP